MSLIHDGVAPQYKIVDDVNSEVEQVIGWLNECLENNIKLSEICIAAPSMQLLKGIQTRLHRELAIQEELLRLVGELDMLFASAEYAR